MPELLPPLSCPLLLAPRPLGEAQVHLWQLDLRRFDAAHAAAAQQLMDASEQQRAGSFIRGQADYIASRWLLRTCLARYTGTAAHNLEFRRTDKGKPFIAGSNIHFSLSHSGHWALLAVARAPLLGVDIEVRRRARDLHPIAQRYFHAQEYTRLRNLPEGLQADYFYRLWTLKEAFFKATGSGIAAGLDNIHFALGANGIVAEINPTLESSGQPWFFQQWQLEREPVALACAMPKAPEVIWLDALCAPAFP